MTRLKKIDRPKSLELYLPESLHTKVMQELYSEVEGKIPFGAISALGTQLFSDWLRSRGVSL